MKNIFCLLFILVCLSSSAQNVSGLYMGTLVNDSTKRVQNYELALSEYREKITGYSYTTFVVNDTFYYSIKRVKGTRMGEELVVEDVKMIANNFPESPAKGVRQIVTIPLNAKDSLIDLKGRWKTTETKRFRYYSLKGGLDMKKDNDSTRSALINHLTELNIISTSKASVATAKPTEKKQPQQKADKEQKAPTTIVAATALKTTLPAAQRRTNIIQTIDVSADSLTLYFYDNGVVDGDTVSVAINGQNIISNLKLTGVAAKKTIAAANFNSAELSLILIAENLGSIPPNTGLVVIQDGDTKHQVTFSADLQTNAAIVIRKKAAGKK